MKQKLFKEILFQRAECATQGQNHVFIRKLGQASDSYMPRRFLAQLCLRIFGNTLKTVLLSVRSDAEPLPGFLPKTGVFRHIFQ